MNWTFLKPAVVPTQRPRRRLAITAALLASLSLVAGCEGSSLGDRIGESLEADPQLADNPNPLGGSANSDSPSSTPDQNTRSADSNNTSTSSENSEQAPETPSEPDPNAVVAGDYTDIGKAPEELQAYIVDLIELGLLEVRPPTPQASQPSTPSAADQTDASEDDEGEEDADAAPAPAPNIPGPDEFRPNQAVTRREYARWLLAVNNKLYEGERDRKIRPGLNSSQPVFQDVPISDPDFEAIQGLAEAGIIPSPLTGSSTTVTFRPDAPLTRKDLILWKVPLDTRQPLPAATVSAVQQAWGFQDADKIEPRALQAVLADHQNGDFANFRRAYSYTTLFQPDKAATRGETAAVLWRFGNPAEGITAAELRTRPATEEDS